MRKNPPLNLARSATSLLPVELESLGQGNAQSLQEFLARGFLAIDSGHFLDPPDPRIAFLLDDRGKRLLHRIPPSTGIAKRPKVLTPAFSGAPPGASAARRC
jgi:hypothetical protein